MSTPSLQLRLSMEQVEPRTYDVDARKHGGSQESVDANPSDESKKIWRDRILFYIKSCLAYGATNKEIAFNLGKGINAISPRVYELREAGLIFKNGQRRDKSAVHVAGV